jgi:16S rRNA (uracil1498-N3)-methyltransferase
MTRLLVAPASLAPGTLAVTGEDHHYLFRVLRMRAGDQVTLFDGEGRQASAEVATIGARTADLRVGEPTVAPSASPARLTVLLSVIKGEGMDVCLPRLVELGVGRIIPVLAERGVVKLEGERAEKRRERYRAQVRAAAQQCRSGLLPLVDPVSRLGEALARVAGADLKLMLWEDPRAVPLRSVLPAEPPAQVAMLVGPEGGWTEEEVERAREAGFVAIGLGPRILRAETAAITGAAILAYALGDL